MPGLSEPFSMGAGRCESWEDGGQDIWGVDETSSESRQLKSAFLVACQPFELTVVTWKH